MPIPLKPTYRARILAATALVAALGATAGCRASAAAFGSSPSAAESNASDLFAAMAQRFTNVQRDPKFFRARGRLGRYALTPSKIWDDTSVWSAVGADSTRSLSLEGAYADGRYLFSARPAAPAPDQVADSRHVMRLRRVGDSEYEWNTSVEHAVGRVRAGDIADVFAATLAAVASRAAAGGAAAAERGVRADYRAAFPRATAQLGQMFSLDELRATPGSDGTTTIALRVGLHPDRLRRNYPEFAKYVEKYVVPSRYHFVLSDATGARWLDAAAGKSVLTVQLRATPAGRMAPLEGPPRAMPQTLSLSGEFITHIMLFDVGVSDLKADFTVLRSEHERGWLMRFREQPDWHLPLASRYLIRAPLRRPFQKEGASLRIAVRDSDDGQTLITRNGTMVVQESAILRWLGALGFTAMSDFAGKSEAEENRFNADLFYALRSDVRALAPTLRPTGAAP